MYTFLFKSKFLGFVEAPVGILSYLNRTENYLVPIIKTEWLQIFTKSPHRLTLTQLSPSLFYSNEKKRNRQACNDYAHNLRTAGLHTIDIILLEAVRDVNVADF